MREGRCGSRGWERQAQNGAWTDGGNEKGGKEERKGESLKKKGEEMGSE